MGRKANMSHIEAVIRAIQQNDGQVRANDIARMTGLHPEAVSRALARVPEYTGILLQEDDNGFLGIFKRSR